MRRGAKEGRVHIRAALAVGHTCEVDLVFRFFFCAFPYPHRGANSRTRTRTHKMPRPLTCSPCCTSGRGGGRGRPGATLLARVAAADPASVPPPFTHPPSFQDDGAVVAPQLLVMRAPMVLFTDPPPVAPSLVDNPATSFKPVLSPRVAAAAAFASVPPVVFWVRIALNTRRVAKEAEDKEAAKEAARLQLLARLSPGKQRQAEQ